MKTVADVRRLLKQFGTVIYTGDQEGDIELMIEELKELKEMGMIDMTTFSEAFRVLLTCKKKNKYTN
jgi:uncharacterized protein YqgQ